MPLLAEIVEGRALLETVIYSLVAAVGVTLAFSVSIYGAATMAEMRRNDRNAAAVAATLLMLAGLAVFASAIALGVIVMTTK